MVRREFTDDEFVLGHGESAVVSFSDKGISVEKATAAKIGVPRICPGETIPVLYPGEQAFAQGKIPTVEELAEADGPVTVIASDWSVEPMPGWWGLFLRTRYRLARFLHLSDRSEPKLDVDIRTLPGGFEDE